MVGAQELPLQPPRPQGQKLQATTQHGATRQVLRLVQLERRATQDSLPKMIH